MKDGSKRTFVPITRPWLPPLEEYVDLLREIWQTRMLSNFSSFSQHLEELVSQYIGCRTLAVASGDTGLVLTLAALDLPEYSPCFVSSFTFNSTINAALWNRLTPVIVDADPDSFNMSIRALEKAINRTSRPGVMLATHVFGNPCDVDQLETLAKGHGSALVFDAAHALGTERNGIRAGCYGDAEVFSLSGTKVVTAGEGGIVCSKHDWLLEKVRYLRGYGFQNDYLTKYVGLNGKMSELHAALGILSFQHLESHVSRRQEIQKAYRRNLDDDIQFQFVRPQDRSTYKDIAVRVGHRRSSVELALRHASVQFKRYFVPLHSMAHYKQFAARPLSVAEDLHENLLCLPVFEDLQDEEVARICQIINSAYSETGIT